MVGCLTEYVFSYLLLTSEKKSPLDYVPFTAFFPIQFLLTSSLINDSLQGSI